MAEETSSIDEALDRTPAKEKNREEMGRENEQRGRGVN